MPSGIGTAGGRRPARVRLQGDPLSIPKLAPMSAVGMTAKNVTVRSPTRCSPRSSSSRPPSRASGAATPTGPGTTFRLLGVPVRVSTQVPGALAGGELILADMNQVALGRDTAPSLGCSPRPLPTPTSSPASPVASSGGRPACAASSGSVPTVVTSRRHTSEPGTYL